MPVCLYCRLVSNPTHPGPDSPPLGGETMPTPPKKCLRLHELEDRSLMSADAVVTGTDAHDVITLNRLGRYRVDVSVQSFRDAEWTQPTGDPVERYELQLTPDQLDAVWEGDIVPAMAV